MRTVVGVFPTIAEAEGVATSLEQLGIPYQSINVVAGNEKRQHDEFLKLSKLSGAGVGQRAASAAETGAAVGGGVGLVAGLIALAIPGVGPIIAGGALVTALAGLGVGAAAGGLIGAFAEIGVPGDDASMYEEAVRRGGVVVSAQVNDPMETDALRVMDQNGARDVQAEADVWRASGWAGPALGGVVFDPLDTTLAVEQARMSSPLSAEFRQDDGLGDTGFARSYPVKTANSKSN